MTNDEQLKVLLIFCRADSGCIKCAANLLAHYCLDFDADPEKIAKIVAQSGRLRGADESLLKECIDGELEQIVKTLPANEIPV